VGLSKVQAELLVLDLDNIYGRPYKASESDYIVLILAKNLRLLAQGEGEKSLETGRNISTFARMRYIREVPSEMNLKLRLERLCDNRAWVRLHFGDGTSLVGKLFKQGHDYVEMETYGDIDKRATAEYSKHIIPLSLIKYLTIESTTFAEAERRRLDYLAHRDPELDHERNPDGLSELEK